MRGGARKCGTRRGIRHCLKLPLVLAWCSPSQTPSNQFRCGLNRWHKSSVYMKELKVFAVSLLSTIVSLVMLGMTLRLLWEAIKLGWSFVDLFLWVQTYCFLFLVLWLGGFGHCWSFAWSMDSRKGSNEKTNWTHRTLPWRWWRYTGLRKTTNRTYTQRSVWHLGQHGYMEQYQRTAFL